MTEIEAAALDYARKIFEGDSSGHDYFHTERVYKTALRLAETENADREIVALAAILHDVDDRKLSPETSESKANAVSFLKSHGICEEKISKIVKAISEVSFTGTNMAAPTSIEAKCVQDADRLEAIGAIGIARAFAYGGSRGRMLYDPDNISGSTIGHFYDKLLLLKDMLNTDSARKTAEERDSFMRAFLDEFYAEWEGKK